LRGHTKALQLCLSIFGRIFIAPLQKMAVHEVPGENSDNGIQFIRPGMHAVSLRYAVLFLRFMDVFSRFLSINKLEICDISTSGPFDLLI